MTAILIGSRAENFILKNASGRDWDFIARPKEIKTLIDMFPGKVTESYPISGNHHVVKIKNGDKTYILDIEIAFIGSSGEKLVEYAESVFGKCLYQPATIRMMQVIRESHRYRDSVHFHKNMVALDNYKNDIPAELMSILKLRESETYTRKPIKLNVSKTEFFSNDGVDYVYEHDDLHSLMAFGDEPAYKRISSGEVLTSVDKFNALTSTRKDQCVIEEALVIAIERGYIPFKVVDGKRRVWTADDAHALYQKALQKICTTLTSGHFREYASKNYLRLVQPYSYYKRFSGNFIDYFAGFEFTLKPLK